MSAVSYSLGKADLPVDTALETVWFSPHLAPISVYFTGRLHARKR
jgi:hypothetical protein